MVIGKYIMETVSVAHLRQRRLLGGENFARSWLTLGGMNARRVPVLFADSIQFDASVLQLAKSISLLSHLLRCFDQLSMAL